MCHGRFESELWRAEELADGLLDEGRADDPVPSFLNEERETDVEILTDGGAE